jgi:hypothetical protein
VKEHESGYVEIDGYGRIPFTDAILPQTLEITEQDIQRATCGDPRQCVVAQSARRSFGKHMVEVLVYKTVVHVIFQKGAGIFESVRYVLDGKLLTGVHEFDLSRKPDGSGAWKLGPGLYSLSVPSPSDRHGGRPNRRKLYGGKGGKQQKGEKVMQALTRRLLGKNRKTKLPEPTN